MPDNDDNNHDLSLEECNIDYEHSDEPDVGNTDVPNAIMLQNT